MYTSSLQELYPLTRPKKIRILEAAAKRRKRMQEAFREKLQLQFRRQCERINPKIARLRRRLEERRLTLVKVGAGASFSSLAGAVICIVLFQLLLESPDTDDAGRPKDKGSAEEAAGVEKRVEVLDEGLSSCSCGIDNEIIQTAEPALIFRETTDRHMCRKGGVGDQRQHDCWTPGNGCVAVQLQDQNHEPP